VKVLVHEELPLLGMISIDGEGFTYSCIDYRRDNFLYGFQCNWEEGTPEYLEILDGCRTLVRDIQVAMKLRQ
jgi:hypothetical protein